VESNARQGLPGQHPGLGDHFPDRIEDPVRASTGRSRPRHTVNVEGGTPFAVTASPHAAFHRSRTPGLDGPA